VGLFAAIVAAAPTVPVALKVTGLPDKVPEDAVNVFWPAVGLSVQLPTVATPLAFVVWLPPVMVPFPGATANVTATPTTALPNPSVTSTEGGIGTALPAGAVWPLPSCTAIVAAAAGVTFTVAVCVTVTVPFTLAVTVLVPAAVELSVPVAWPFTSVVAAGCVSVLPVVGVAASVTVAPLTGLPPASRTVTVIVLEPEPAVIVAGAAATDDCDALGPPAVAVARNTTGLPASPVAVARSVSTPAVGPNVHDVTAAMPLASLVTAVVGLTVPLPAAGVNVTATPATALPNWSRTMAEGAMGTALPTVAV
jgi:hypothetical protein